MTHDKPTDPPPARATTVQPDNLLKQKLGDGGFDAKRVALAEKRIHDARVHFPIMARRELHAINTSLVALYDPVVLLRDIFAAAVDLKSNSALFSFDIVSSIADSLVRFTETLTTIDQHSLTIIQLHYNAMQLVFEQGHDVMTKDQRDEMLDGLRKAVDKYQHDGFSQQPVKPADGFE